MPRVNEKSAGKDYPFMCVLGPSGSGKTWLAATASEHYVLRPARERTPEITLSDMLWFQFDRDGLATVQSLGMEPYFIDLSMPPTLEQGALFLTQLKTKMPEYAKLCVDRGIRYVVVDTFTMLYQYILQYSMFSVKGADKDPRLAYTPALFTMLGLMLEFRQLPAAQIWLAHSRSIYQDKETEGAKARQDASLPGEFLIDMDINNAAANKIRRFFSLSVALEADLTTGGRKIVTSEKNGTYYVKERYPGMLLPKEEANLAKLFNKINSFSTVTNAQPK